MKNIHCISAKRAPLAYEEFYSMEHNCDGM